MTLRPLPLLAALALAAPASAQPADLFARMAERVEAEEDALVALRHDLHRHPELSGEEERTAGVLAAHLAGLGFDVQTGVGGHGVVAVLEGGRPGPAVAFRADMDAVRSSDEDPVAYRSVISGVRHICGHDVHMAVGIGIAEGVAAVREALPGTVVLVFQPAEERGDGAKAMLADGLFETGAPDAIFALHTAPYPVGAVATVPGGMMAGRALVEVTLRGGGDLRDATEAVRAAIESVGTVAPAAAILPAPPGFALVNLVPQRPPAEGEAVVRGFVMTAGYDDRVRTRDDVLAALDALDLPGVTIEARYDERFMEGVTNDADLVDLANAGIEALAPEVSIQTVGGAVPAFSEDFGSFQALAPGAMYFLGVSNPEAGTVGMPHTPGYVADDAAIAVGTRAMLAAMLARLTAG